MENPFLHESGKRIRPSTHHLSHFEATSRTPCWIEFAGIAEFDLLQGQFVRCLHPKVHLTSQEEKELSFLCFPDCALEGDCDTMHDFVFTWTLGDTPAQEKSIDGSSTKRLFCSSLFRQRCGPSYSRGAQRRSLFVASVYPFPIVHRALLQAAMNDLGSENYESLPCAIWQGVRRWPPPVPSASYSVQFLGRSLNFSTPCYGADCASISLSSDDIVVRPLSALQQLLCSLEASEGDIELPPDLCEELRHENPKLAGLLVSSDDGGAFLHRSKIDEALSALYLGGVKAPPVLDSHNAADGSLASREDENVRRLTSYFPRRIQFGSCLWALQNLQLSKLYERHKEDIQNAEIHPAAERNILSELSIERSLQPHLSKCWKLWELLIAGEPLAIIASNSACASAAALTILSLIAPIPTSRTFLPYITMCNRQLDELVIPPRSGLVAATNPYFVKFFDRWPNLLCIGKCRGLVHDTKVVSSSSADRGKMQFNLKSRMFCLRHFHVKSGKAHGSPVSNPDAEENYVDCGDSALYESENSDHGLRAHFAELTASFLLPLRQCVSRILLEERPYFLPNDQFRKLFGVQRLLDCVKKSSSLPISRFKSEGDALKLYELFLTSSSFLSWLQHEIHLNYRHFLLSADSLADVVLHHPDPPGRYRALFLLQCDYENALMQPLADIPLIEKLGGLCSRLPALRLSLFVRDQPSEGRYVPDDYLRFFIRFVAISGSFVVLLFLVADGSRDFSKRLVCPLCGVVCCSRRSILW